jgi:hypothetical protein
MLKEQNNQDKLYPLRRFVIPGLYEVPYLSLLVQRKKLKAKKIGRNYFTCEKWFTEYVERHADNEKWGKYQEIKKQETLQYGGQARRKIQTNSKFKITNNRAVFALAMTVFVLVIVGVQVFVNYRNSQGVISGEYEVNSQTASSTKQY